MKINSFIFCGIILTACNCTSTIVDHSTDTGTLGYSESSTDVGVFTSTDSSFGSESTSSDSTTYYASDLNFVESSSTANDEPTLLCNNSDEGKCRVFVSSLKTFPNIEGEGFDNFCTSIMCGSEWTCEPFKALIRTDSDFWSPFSKFNGEYVLPSGKVIATGTDSLQYASSINEDETGKIVPDKTLVWTGFNHLNFTCHNNNVPWKTNHPDQFADIGYVGGVNETWYTGEQVSCNTTAHVICVEMVKE